MMEAVFLKLFNLSVQAGFLTLAVLAARALTSRTRMPKSVRCLMWALVGLRLICPFSVESAVSLLPGREVITVESTASGRTPEVHTGVPALDEALGGALAPSQPSQETPSVPADSSAPAPPASPEVPTVPASPAAEESPLAALISWASRVWLAGTAALTLYFFISAVSLRRRVSGAVETEAGVWESRAVPSPFVFGAIRPRIYLPLGLDPKHREYVLAHERSHIERRDYLFKPLAFLILAVYWFNPLMWLAYVLLTRDIELACDERVLGKLGPGVKRPYSEALLAAVTFHRHVAACPVAFGEGKLTGRVKNVLRWKRPVLWMTLASLLLCGVLAACFLTDPADEGPDAAGSYVYEGQAPNPLFSPFVITLWDKDGERTFSYMEGMASSYIGMGSWTLDGDIVTLTDTGSSRTRTFRFNLTEEGLRYIADGSDSFTYVDVADGDLFRLTDEDTIRDMSVPDTGGDADGADALADVSGEYVFNADGSPGSDRTIALYSDGAFNYDGGIFASTAWVGTWTLEGDVVTLTNDTEVFSEDKNTMETVTVTNRLRVTPEGLAFIEGESDGLIYATDLYDGAVFLRVSSRPTGEATPGGVSWTLDNGILTISGEGPMEEYGPPNTTAATPWYHSMRDEITSVVVEEGVTRLGAYAFYGLEKLESVTLPSGVVSAGGSVFTGCASLTDLYFGGSSMELAPIWDSLNLAQDAPSATVHPAGEEPFTAGDGLPSWAASNAVAFETVESSGFAFSLVGRGVSPYGGDYRMTQLGVSVAQQGRESVFYPICPLVEDIDGEYLVYAGRVGSYITVYDMDCPLLVVRYLSRDGTLRGYFCAVKDGRLYTLIGSIPWVRAGYETIGTVLSDDLTADLTANTLHDNGTGVDYVFNFDNIVPNAYPGPHFTASGREQELPNRVKYYIALTNVFPILDPLAGNGSVECSFEDGTLTISGNGPMEDYERYTITISPMDYDEISCPWYGIRDQIQRVVINEGVTSIGAYAFFGCENLRDIVLPSTVKAVGAYAFSDCDSLVSVDFPEGVTTLGRGMFWRCGSLTSVTIPDGVTEIPVDAFYDCRALTDVTFPSTLKKIGETAFHFCAIKSVELPEGLEEIGPWAFMGTGLSGHIEIPSTVKVIGADAFSECASLTSVTLPEGLEKISAALFSGSGITEIEIPDSVTEIGVNAFWNCRNLTSITVPGSVRIIGDGAFQYCNDLEEVSLSTGLQELGEAVFAGTYKLKSVNIPEGVTRIGRDAFSGSHVEIVRVPGSVTEIGVFAFDGANSIRIVFGGTPEQWAALTSDSRVAPGAQVEFETQID